MSVNEDFEQKCLNRFNKIKSVLCAGLDPAIEKFPPKFRDMQPAEAITSYFVEVADAVRDAALVSKPNIAFYEQYGAAGLAALHTIIDKLHNCDIPVVLDAKRGDIGNTAKAYAKAVFDDFGADAVTLSPYMGIDSLQPFFDYTDRGCFVLCRTSNKGSSDFQLLQVGDMYLYEAVAHKIIEWNKAYNHNIGAVVGATQIEELRKIATLFSDKGYPPLLIPGVGTQGGSFDDVMAALRAVNYPLHKVFINSSSKLTYSHAADEDYLAGVLSEAKKFILQ